MGLAFFFFFFFFLRPFCFSMTLHLHIDAESFQNRKLCGYYILGNNARQHALSDSTNPLLSSANFGKVKNNKPSDF